MSPFSTLDKVLTGTATHHLVPLDGSGVLIHSEMLPALERLTRQAASAGFDLRVASGFRAFDAQLRIWNEKALGLRPVLDSAGTPLQIATLCPEERVFAILRWSALPGASRHHWGTDIDVYDLAAMPDGYKLQLTSEEAAPEGIFGPFHAWLNEARLAAEGFFRPYSQDRGGVAPERWHLSWQPVSERLQEAYSLELIETVIRAAPLELKAAVLAKLDEIYHRFIEVPPHAKNPSVT